MRASTEQPTNTAPPSAPTEQRGRDQALSSHSSDRTYSSKSGKATPKPSITWLEEVTEGSGEGIVTGPGANVAASQGDRLRIDWGQLTADGCPDPKQLIGLEDAYEHTRLRPGEVVAYCVRDRVAYHWRTWEFLLAENEGRCCSCGGLNTIRKVILPMEPTKAPPETVEAKPAWSQVGLKVIGLEEVERCIGLAVVVQAYVYEVYRSQIGTYFIKFEPRSEAPRPYSGFKAVIRPRYASAWMAEGVSPEAYQNNHVQIRGVIQRHPDWGIEVLINSPRVVNVVGPGNLTT